MPNVIVAPHIAGQSTRSAWLSRRRASQQVAAVLRGETNRTAESSCYIKTRNDEFYACFKAKALGEILKNSVIEQITTLRNPNYPKIVWVLIKTNDGIEGIGETSYDPDTVESFILGEASDYLLEKTHLK